jgi:hypothetical protein
MLFARFVEDSFVHESRLIREPSKPACRSDRDIAPDHSPELRPPWGCVVFTWAGSIPVWSADDSSRDALTAPAWTLFQNSWEVPFGMTAMDNARRPLSCRAQPVDVAATPAVMQNAAPRRSRRRRRGAAPGA